MPSTTTRRLKIPPHWELGKALFELIRRLGGRVEIQPEVSDWTIFRELGARLRLSEETQSAVDDNGTVLWENRVRWARKRLELAGVFEPVENSGRGIWRIAPRSNWDLKVCNETLLPSQDYIHKLAVESLSLTEFQSCGSYECLTQFIKEREADLRDEFQWWNTPQQPSEQ